MSSIDVFMQKKDNEVELLEKKFGLTLNNNVSSGWYSVKLRELCEEITIVNPKKILNGYFSYVDVSSVSNQSFKIIETKQIKGKDAPSRARKQIKTSDVIFATVRPALRRVALVPPELNNQICSTGFCVIRVNKVFLNPDYIYFYLLTDQVNQQVASLEKGATYPAINDNELLNLFVPLPPLPEQRAIAHILQTVQQAIQTRCKELELERERKAALMQHLFTHGTHNEPTKQSEVGEIPESWEVQKLGEIANVISGGTPDRTKPEYWSGNIPWVKTGEINYNVILDTEEKISRQGLDDSSARIIPTGTLLMAMYGQGITRGRVAILGIDSAVNQACAAICVEDENLTKFLFHFLTFRYELIRELGHGANQRNLNSMLIKSISVPVPSKNEQKGIAVNLSACDTKIITLEKEITLHEELFRTLLDELMTGRISTLPLIEQLERETDE